MEDAKGHCRQAIEVRIPVVNHTSHPLSRPVSKIFQYFLNPHFRVDGGKVSIQFTNEVFAARSFLVLTFFSVLASLLVLSTYKHYHTWDLGPGATGITLFHLYLMYAFKRKQTKPDVEWFLQAAGGSLIVYLMFLSLMTGGLNMIPVFIILPLVFLALHSRKWIVPWVVFYCGFLLLQYVVIETDLFHAPVEVEFKSTHLILTTPLMTIAIAALLKRDCKHRMILTDALVAALTEANQLTESKNRFLSNFSHELRSPLNGIVGIGETMVASLNCENAKLVRSIIDSGMSLVSLLDDVMDFAKLQAGNLHLDSFHFDPLDVVRAVLDATSSDVRACGLEVVCKWSGRHLSASTGSFMRGDANRLRQVLMNLVSHALHRAHSTVLVEVHELETTLAFSVQDDGGSVGSDGSDLVLALSSLGHGTANRSESGTGLGLLVAELLAEAMQGQITLNDEAPFATFTLQLPVRVQPVPQPAVCLERERRAKTVAVVDDTLNGQRMVETLTECKVNCVPLSLEQLRERPSVAEALDGVVVDVACPYLLEWKEKLDALNVALVPSAARGTTPQELRKRLGLSDEQKVPPMIPKPFVGCRELVGVLETALAPVQAVSIVCTEPVTVVSVDDNTVNLCLLHKMLSRFPHVEVHDFTRADLAIDFLKSSQRPAVVFMDIHMPHVDGLEATRRLRALEASGQIPHSFIAAVTADVYCQAECVEAGVSEFMRKPYSLANLTALLTCACHQLHDPPAGPTTNGLVKRW